MESKYKIVISKTSIIVHVILPESKCKGTSKIFRKREQAFRKLDSMRKGIIEQSNPKMNTVRNFILITVKRIMDTMIINTKKWGLVRIKHTQNYRISIQDILIGHLYIHKTKRLTRKIYSISLNLEQETAATIIKMQIV